jgi:hypothetical protein
LCVALALIAATVFSVGDRGGGAMMRSILQEQQLLDRFDYVPF